MGNFAATGMAEQVAEGQMDLRAALHWHLTSNHFPPVPESMVDVAEEALEGVRQGASLTEDCVELPEGAEHRRYGRSVPLGEIIRVLHLEAFIGLEEEE